MSKIALIGGGGVRTPFLVYGLNEAAAKLGVTELALYDVDRDRAELMGALGSAVVRKYGGQLKVSVFHEFERAVADSTFVINSIRVGGMDVRAADERIVSQYGLAGQETTGPGGCAMALRTIPVAVEYARTVERISPSAWFVNFTNPAGLITQAIATQAGIRSVGICDTPRELFHRIAISVGGSLESVVCDYFGLNHLGWVRAVRRDGKDVTAELMDSDERLRSLYSDQLFDPGLIRALGVIPTEYLFFYYGQRRAVANQAKAGTTRGQEITRLTVDLFRDLQRELRSGQSDAAIALFSKYHRQRIGSYMRLEASAGSLLAPGVEDPNDPFTSETGYHRIAIQVMEALLSKTPRRIVINASNRGAIPDLLADDVVEIPCMVSEDGIFPIAVGSIPSTVRGLLLSVKSYERLAVEAAIQRSPVKARLALLLYPIVGQWDLATDVLEALGGNDPTYLGFLRQKEARA